MMSFGSYPARMEPPYARWCRLSRYVAVRDGTRLAVSVFRPCADGLPTDKPLPVIWMQDWYNQAYLGDFEPAPAWHPRHPQPVRNRPWQTWAPWLEAALGQGYVVGIVDGRGTGASRGVWEGPFARREAHDAYDITEWFARQSWCNGRVGMFGRSYAGIAQFLAAAEGPPHLHAIFPEMALFDLHAFTHAGAIFREDFAKNWSGFLCARDENIPPDPVDSDPAGEELAAALAERRQNWNAYDTFAPLPFRDSCDASGRQLKRERDPAERVCALAAAGIPYYLQAGWRDLWPLDAFLWYRNAPANGRLIVGPWHHEGDGGDALVAEHLRWYDHWLKGRQTGVCDEPVIRYSTIMSGGKVSWKTASHWPLSTPRDLRFFLHAEERPGAGGTIRRTRPDEAVGFDRRRMDLTATSGSTSRWAGGYGGKVGYGDMAPNDRKGLSYTSEPLSSSIEVSGHPRLHLWLEVNGSDADLFVYLEDVDLTGHSRYVTEGQLRVSQRRLGSPAYDNWGLICHSGRSRDVTPPRPGEVLEVQLALLPTSYLFEAGRRIRIAITGADCDNCQPLAESPILTIHRDTDRASFVDLPAIGRTGQGLVSR